MIMACTYPTWTCLLYVCFICKLLKALILPMYICEVLTICFLFLLFRIGKVCYVIHSPVNTPLFVCIIDTETLYFNCISARPRKNCCFILTFSINLCSFLLFLAMFFNHFLSLPRIALMVSYHSTITVISVGTNFRAFGFLLYTLLMKFVCVFVFYHYALLYFINKE